MKIQLSPEEIELLKRGLTARIKKLNDKAKNDLSHGDPEPNRVIFRLNEIEECKTLIEKL